MSRDTGCGIRDVKGSAEKVVLYHQLAVWQLSMDLAEEMYRLTKDFPRSERFGLGSQIQRAAVSIPANIAEGNARRSRADYLRHVSIARGSWAELQSHLELARRLGYIDSNNLRTATNLTDRVGQMLSRLITSLGVP